MPTPSMGDVPGVGIKCLSNDWDFWTDLTLFCERAPERMETFVERLDFNKLD